MSKITEIKDFDAYLLDLDGTLTDSKPGIFNCIRYALDFYGVKCPDEKFLNNLIGPPLAESFLLHFGFSPSDAKDALLKYRERYEKLGINEIALYPNVAQTLKSLNEKGKIVALATSKVSIYAQIILDKFNLTQYFHHIQGGDMDGKFCGKSDVVRLCLEELTTKFGVDKNKCVMVGDRKYDIIGAKENGIKSIGVTYGYAEQTELTDYGADYTIESFNQLT